MKWLSIIFSVLTLYVLVTSLFSKDNVMSEDKALTVASAFTQPSEHASKLAIEVDWLIDHEKLAEKRKAAQKKATKKTHRKPVKIYPTLTVAGIDYQLLGIFKGESLPFILIKADKLPIKKVIQGSMLSPGVVLQEVLASKITLSNAGSTIEFKLFEPITRV
jgi:hypothetical protein